MNGWRMIGVLLLPPLAACGEHDAGDATTRGVVLGAVEERRIDAATADLSRVSYMLAAPTGDLLLAQSEDGHIKLFRADGSIDSIGRNGGGPGEFDRLTRIGWLGDSLWALDPGLMRVSIFGPDYAFVRSYASPGGNALASDGTEPYSMFLQAVLPGGHHRVLVSMREGMEQPEWLRGVASGGHAFARVDQAGEVTRLVAISPVDPCMVHWTVGTAGSAAMKLPYCDARIGTDWDGTTSLGFVDTELTEGGASSYRVTILDPEGDTTLARSYAFSPIPVNQAMIDSAEARRAEIEAQSNPATYANRPEIRYPAARPPVKRLVLGGDGTIWVELQTNSAPHTWQVLAASGDEIGRVTLPANFKLMTANRERIWGLERDPDDLESIVTYRVTGP